MLSDDDKLVGSRVRVYRKLKELSQTDLANAIGVSLHQLQRYEKGQARIAASRLSLLASKLNVEPSAFFSATLPGDEPVRGQFVGTDAADERRQLNEAFQRIKSTRIRHHVLKLVESVGRRARTASAAPARSRIGR